MKPTIENLKDTFKISLDAYADSRKEQQEITDLYHNRHYTTAQLAKLEKRGQPKETFNVVKMYHRMLIGYFNTVVNTVKVSPNSIQDLSKSALIQDVINTELRINKCKKLIPTWASDMLLKGMPVVSIIPRDTGKKDRFGRPEIKLDIERIPPEQVLPDPMHTRPDYSDARWVHTFKWMPEEEVIKMFGEEKVKSIPSNTNTENIENFEFVDKFNTEFTGHYKIWDNYLIILSFMVDGDTTHAVYWCDTVILEDIKLDFDGIRFPIRPYILEPSDRPEIYGPFRELVETQKAINQALLQIQLLVNSNKVMVDDSGVEKKDLATFEEQYNRVNGIIKVKNLGGIRVEKLSAEIVEQYRILDNALMRIQRVLNINDAFMGMAQASDSGRKVRLQQNSSIVSLSYLTEHLEFMLEEMAMDIAKLAKQFYNSERWMRVTDDDTKERWVQLNKPFMMPTGNRMPDGRPEATPVFTEVLDKEDKPVKDEAGNYMIRVINEAESEITFDEIDIKVTASTFNDSDDIERMVLETIIQGPAGAFAQAADPAGYAKIVSYHVKGLKSRHSEDIAGIFENIAMKLGGAKTMDPRLLGGTGGQPGEDMIGKMASALGATNDAKPAGYNTPRG